MSTGAPVTPTKPKTSALAIKSLTCWIIGACSLAILSVGLVLGIVGLLFWIIGGCLLGILSIVGLILGIASLKKIKASGGTVGGRGLAIADIIICIFTLIIGLALAALITGDARSMGYQAVCQSNLMNLCTAAIFYSADQKGQFPPAGTWPEVLKKGGYILDRMLTCPGKENAGRTYAMNAKLGGIDISLVRQRSKTVLFFECSPGSPASGGLANLASEPPHTGGRIIGFCDGQREGLLLLKRPRNTGGWIIGFCDGHVEVVPPNRRDQLIWEP